MNGWFDPGRQTTRKLWACPSPWLLITTWKWTTSPTTGLVLLAVRLSMMRLGLPCGVVVAVGSFAGVDVGVGVKVGTGVDVGVGVGVAVATEPTTIVRVALLF